MAQAFKNLFGGEEKPANPVSSGDSDFADFAGAADPSPASILPPAAAGPGVAATARPYTKWYNVHERHSLSEFKAEGMILACVAIIMVVHLVGARLNRSRARRWATAHAAPLASEFALVGFDGVPPALADRPGDELVEALGDANAQKGPEGVLREKSLFEFASYATGRQNVAFLDVKLTMQKRFNPLQILTENVIGFFFESFAGPEDALEAVLYPFDGMEASTVPGLPGAAELRARDSKSTFDGFVWAVVNKERMKQLREDRYDLSITSTRDNAKLPSWLTVMTESAEITDTLLTPDLISAVRSAGELLDYLVVSDQPIDKPKTIDEAKPRKRVFLRYRLPGDGNYEPLLPIFQYFVRMSDQLVQSAHFRAEVTRKLRVVREENIKQIQKADEEEKAEERALEREKAKRAKRDQELSGLDAKAQKKYLEREKEKEKRKLAKKQTARA